MITGVWHFSFHVSSIERSLSFYVDVLSLELVHAQDQENPYTSLLVGYPDASLRVAQLRLPGGVRPTVSSHMLELVEYVRPRGSVGRFERCDPGASHLAFAVDDIHAEFERLTSLGVDFVSPPNAITAGINTGGFACYFVDPDGITLELVQPPAMPKSH